MEKMNKLSAAAVIAIIASIFAANVIADTENYGSEFSVSESPQPPQPTNATAYFGSELEITGGNNPPVPPAGDTEYFGSELLIGDEPGPSPWVTIDNSMLFWYFIALIVIVFIIGLVAIVIFARR